MQLEQYTKSKQLSKTNRLNALLIYFTILITTTLFVISGTHTDTSVQILLAIILVPPLYLVHEHWLAYKKNKKWEEIREVVYDELSWILYTIAHGVSAVIELPDRYEQKKAALLAGDIEKASQVRSQQIFDGIHAAAKKDFIREKFHHDILKGEEEFEGYDMKQVLGQLRSESKISSEKLSTFLTRYIEYLDPAVVKKLIRVEIHINSLQNAAHRRSQTERTGTGFTEADIRELDLPISSLCRTLSPLIEKGYCHSY